MKPKIETDTWTNGQKQHEIPHINNQRHGLATWWYDNGQKWTKTHYVNGQLHGLETGWFSDGSLSWIRKWHQDQLVWEISFPLKEHISEDVEVELFFHETTELI